VEAVVAPDGSTKAVKIKGGDPLPAQAAHDAVQKWKWTPASPRQITEYLTLLMIYASHAPLFTRLVCGRGVVFSAACLGCAAGQEKGRQRWQNQGQGERASMRTHWYGFYAAQVSPTRPSVDQSITV
jgi:hypothetical protein